MKLLAYTSPARGHMYPTIPILTALVARGHETSICTLSEELEHLAPLGIGASAIDPAIARIQIVDWQRRSSLGAMISVLRTFARRAEYEAADLTRAIELHDPDVLLIDINCWGATTVAETGGRPWAIYSPYLLPLSSRDAPPFGPGLRPLGGPIGAMRDALVRRAGEGVFNRTAMPALNALRALHGLSPLERFEDLLRRPPLLLSLTAEGFEYPHSDWPASVQLVGPMNWSPTHPSHPPPAPAPAQAWLAEMSDPVVLVTSSTELQDDARLLNVALEALPAAGMSVIATTAAHDPDSFHAPPGSRVVRFAPHDPLLSRAACVVCHGGLGITQKALSAGVPVVVVPYGRDQLETARRVEVANAGARLSPRRLTSGRLIRAVHAAIDRRAGAQHVGRAFAKAGGAEAAADAIEAVARSGGVFVGDKIRPSSAAPPTSPVATQE